MSAQPLDHDDIADIFTRLAALYPPSELHGFFVGQLVMGQKVEESSLREQTRQLLDLEDLPGSDWSELLKVQQQASEQLAAEIGSLTLLLPDADVDLGQRVAAVSSWCQGFLTGFAMAGKQREMAEGKQSYSETVSEILSDIAAISQAGFDTVESREAEEELAELVGYLEMAAVTVFVECCSQSLTKGNHPAPPQIH